MAVEEEQTAAPEVVAAAAEVEQTAALQVAVEGAQTVAANRKIMIFSVSMLGRFSATYGRCKLLRLLLRLLLRKIIIKIK